MPSIGLTGTVGSGKSLALGFLAELGAETMQADRIGHDLLKQKEVVRKVAALFGNEVIDRSGQLDRSKIGALIFADEELRGKYDALIHPLLLAKLREWIDTPREGVAVVEAALIPEWGIEDWFDEVWCLTCSEETALARWNRDRELFWKIRAAQYAPEKKRAKAERVIENERSQEELRGRIHGEWEQFSRDHSG